MLEYLALLLLFLMSEPILFGILVSRRPLRTRMKGYRPDISVVIPAHDEEEAIGRKLKGLLGMDYPKGKTEIIVVNDHSTDRTREVVKAFGKGVKLIDLKGGRGKIAALNEGIGKARNDIIVMTDADTRLGRASIKRLVSHFRDPGMGAVSGNLIIRDAGIISRMEAEYVRSMNSIRNRESSRDICMYLYGQLSAFRKSHLDRIRDDAGVDDLEIALRLLRDRRKVIQDPRVMVEEHAPRSLRGFLGQKRRRTLASMEPVFRNISLLKPSYGIAAVSFLSQRVLPLFFPLILAGLLASIILMGSTLSLVLIGLMVIAVLLKPLLALHFALMQVAVSLAWMDYLLGRRPRGADWKHRK